MNKEKTIPKRPESTPEQRAERAKIIAKYEAEDCAPFPQSEPICVKSVYEAFADDFAEAQKTYSLKRIELTGVVTRVGPDIHVKPSLELSNSETGRRYALIVFNDDSVYRTVSVGDTVVCRGNLLGAMEPWGPIVKKSEVVSVLPKTNEKLRGKRPVSDEEFKERMKRVAYFEENDCEKLDSSEPLVPEKIYADFLEDYDRAEKLYFEKRVEIKGTIGRIGPDIHGKPSIELTDKPGGRCYALFVFADDSFKYSVKVGDEVVLRGNILNAREPFGLTVKKCEIVSRL